MGFTSYLGMFWGVTGNSGVLDQSGPLIGTWTNITHLEASPPRNTLQAQPIGRLKLEAKDANA